MSDNKKVFTSKDLEWIFDDSKQMELERKLIAREISFKEFCKELFGEYPSDEELKEFAKNNPKLIAE